MFRSDACVVDKSVRGAVVGLSVLLATALVGRPEATAHADHPGCVPPEVTPVLDFPVGAAEGLALSFDGDVFVGNMNTGEIWRAPKGDFTRATLVADLLEAESPLHFLLGMEAAPDGTLYVAVNALIDPAIHGLYTVDPNGTARRIAAAPAQFESALNEVARDARGNVYVSDSLPGEIWRLTPQGEFHVWSASELLRGGFFPALGVEFGVNGLAYHGGALYGAITVNGRIVRVPIGPDGNPGTPSIVVQSDALVGADGIRLDALGNIYVTNNFTDSLLRIRAGEPQIETVVAEHFSGPAGLGITADHRTIYVANLSTSGVIPKPPAPALVKVDFALPIVSARCAP